MHPRSAVLYQTLFRSPSKIRTFLPKSQAQGWTCGVSWYPAGPQCNVSWLGPCTHPPDPSPIFGILATRVKSKQLQYGQTLEPDDARKKQT